MSRFRMGVWGGGLACFDDSVSPMRLLSCSQAYAVVEKQ